MKYLTKDGQELHLRRLSNDEFEYAKALAKAQEIPLSHCPTCRAQPVVVNEGVYGWISGTYRYRGVEYPCDCKTQRALRTQYLAANIGDQYQRLDWAEFEGTKEAAEMVSTYLDKWRDFRAHGYGVEFGGPLGVGKTWAASHIGKELIKRGQNVYFIPFVEMVRSFEQDDGDKIEARVRETPYVILDEIEPGKSDRQREFFATRFEAAIRHRTNHNLPTIITTNVSQDDLHKCYPRIYSLLEAKQLRIDMSGKDARKSVVAMDNLELAMNGEVRPIT